MRQRLAHGRATSAAVVLVVAALALTACGAGRIAPSPDTGASDGSGRPDAALRIVATTTVLADLVAQTGGQRVAVTSIVPAGVEVHTFDPTPEDARSIAGADLIVMNGLGLDDWLRDLAESGGAADVPVVEIAEGLEGVATLPGNGHEAANPHLWLDVDHAQDYVERLRGVLRDRDPDGAAAYERSASAYLERLRALDASVHEQMDALPADARRVISFHEAFPYFAEAYGLEVVATVVDAPGQDPSAGEVAALIDAVRAERVRAILAESQFPDDLVETIAQETGVAVVSDLYSDSLGEPPIDTYEALIRWDVERIVEALR